MKGEFICQIIVFNVQLITANTMQKTLTTAH